MNFINEIKKQYIRMMAKKGVDRVLAKILAKRFVALTLSFILAFSAIVPILAGLSFDAFANEPVFGKNYVDTSSGKPDAEGWLNSGDARYLGQTGALGSESNPYIIKSGDELYSFSLKVKGGNSFADKFIDLRGLSEQEALVETANPYIMSNTIDLRPFDGTTLSASAALPWIPIGTKANPFAGNVFSSTGVSVVNLAYPQNGDYSTDKAYGLFGYNNGKIGEKGKIINVSAMQYATAEGTTKDISIPEGPNPTIQKLLYIGGVVGVNTGTVKNVSFGTGSFCDIDKTKAYDHVYTNGIKTPINNGIVETNSVTGFSVGGIVGYNNGGTVSDCSFTGQIFAQAEDIGVSATKYDDAILKGGFGGIVGFAEGGKIQNSFSNGTIEAGYASYSAFGGIVGNARGTTDNAGTIQKCVFTGKVEVGTLYSGLTVYPASAGGIAGLTGNFGISQCVSGGNVTAKYNGDTKGTANSVPVGGPAGGIVGSASLNNGVTIDQSFSLGTILSGTFAGGIVGANGNSTMVSNSFSVATIKALNYNNQKSEFSVDASTGANGFGGLEGGTSFNGGSTTNSYFAGTTLSSEIGSLFGLKSAGTATNVYFDSGVSPNNAVTKTGKSGEFDGTGSKKTTDDFLSGGAVNLGGEFVKSVGAYPELKWVNDMVSPTTDLEKTIKALSKVATTVTFKATAENSVGNNGEYNGYQMKENKITEGSLINFEADNSIGLSVENWKESTIFNGEYDTGKIGGLFTSAVDIKYGYLSGKIELTRKLIKAVNQTEGSANSISTVKNLEALLDVSRNASGAYTGSIFTFANDIDGKLVAPSARTTTTDDRYREINNLFCSELNGNDHKINEIEAKGSFTSLFGTSLFAKVHNINFGTVTLGTEADKLTLAGQYNALLISRAKGTDFEQINFDTVSANMTVVGSNSSFGMLTAYLETPVNYQNVIRDVNFNSVDVTILKFTANFNYGLVSALNRIENDTAKTVVGQTLSNVQVNDYKLRLGTKSTTGDDTRPSYVGGLFGLTDVYNVSNGNDTIATKNCVINNLYADIDVHEHTGRQGIGFGGITSVSTGGFTNCHVTGKIIGSVGTGSNTALFLVGGITAWGTKTYGSFDNCSFVGAIDGVIVGGIVGRDDGASNFEKCYVQAEINVDKSISATRLAKKDTAGGIIGVASAGNGISKMTNSFFEGTASGKNVGGITGQGKGNIYNSYSKAILESNDSAGAAGGLVGNATGTVNIINSYFAGQVTGAGSAGGLIGKGTVNSAQETAIKSSFFDKSIAGENISTIPAGATEAEQAIATALDARCAVATGNIKATSMTTKINNVTPSPYISETSTNYPQISYFANSANEKEKKLSNQSTQIVFAVEPNSFLTSKPNFELQSDNAYSVERNETTEGIYQKWSDILTFVSVSGKTEPYGKYVMGPKGNTYFTVKYNNYYGSNSLNMKYNIIVKPFDYGSGTKADPYIIYSVDELIKYRKYLKDGLDTDGTYYKIGSVVNGKVVGNPITLDLSGIDDWEPIINATGHLDGNNSVVKNVKITKGYEFTNSSGIKESTYFGFFGSSAHTADIYDLTLDNIKINANSAVDARVGAFMGTSAGGTFTNIVVTNSEINYSGSMLVYAGGLIGSATIGTQVANINNCAVYSDIVVNNNARTAVGGLIGYVSGGNTNINSSAVYGTINNGTYLGGLIGQSAEGIVLVNGTASVVDITTSTSSAKVGGTIGFSSGKNLSTTVKDSFYGGRIIATGANSNMGGMIGYGNAYENYIDRHTFNSQKEISFITPGIFNNESEIEALISGKVDGLNGGNYYYNYDTNPYPTANIEFTGEFKYLEGDVEKNGSKKYSNSSGSIILLGKTTTGKSNMYNMTQKQLTFSDSTKWTGFDSGYFPRPVWLQKDSDDALTQRNELYLNDMSRFYSTAVYYTNAGKAGDEKLTNVFVTGEDANWSGQKTDSADYAKITSNKKMILATGEGVSQNLGLTQTIHGFEFKKHVKFTPSIVPCGVADYSFYFANPKGMWVEEISQDGETITYPWTLYTADQLRGIDSLLKGVSDGNGLEAVNIDYTVTPPDGKKLGEVFTLGVDVAGYEKIDGEIFGYTEFLPIGSDAKPFNTTFNGRGHTVRNLVLASSDEQHVGLFGTVRNGEISNVGIAPSNIQINTTGNGIVGGVAAKLAGNSSIINCFSALSFTDKSDLASNATVGGLVGVSEGIGNSIANSFSTGAIYLTGNNTMAGGLAGNGAGLTIANSYVAGYVEAKNKGVITGNNSGTVTNCYYDIGATGNMANSNGAISQTPTSALLGNSFNDVEGLYPLPTAFATNLTNNVNISAIPVALTNARSVTSGSVSYSGTTLQRLNSLGDYQSIGTISLSDGDTKFEKANTGIAFLGVNYKGISRTAIANLQCWYDAGTENGNHFVINTAKELAEFAQIVNGTLTQAGNPNGNHTHEGVDNRSFKGWTISLGSDIDLRAFTDWVSIGTNALPFEGTFDGTGHVVANFSQEAANIDGNTGIFGTVNGGTIRNFGVASGNSSGGTFAGGIVANSIGANIEYCFNASSVNGVNAGGLAGKVDSKTSVMFCYNMGVVNGSDLAAGIVANNNGVISNSYNTGIVQTTNGIGAGTFASGNGSAVICYNASYVAGTTICPVAPSGTANCSYDSNLLTYNGTVSGVTARIEMAEDSTWTASSDEKYPELKFFADNSSTIVMQDASELSVLKMNFGSGNYAEFVEAKLFGTVTTSDVKRSINLSSVMQNFNVARDGDSWRVEPSTTPGAGEILAGLSSSVALEHKYFAFSVLTMKVRYKFDFTDLFAGNPKENSNYHGENSSSNASTWSGTGTKHHISTADDLIAFAEYANANETKGHTFVLDYSIDMAGKTLPVIGSEGNPFEGMFDGGFYTISNLNISGSGNVAMFGAIGAEGKVLNFKLNNFNVTAEKSSSDMVAASIAASNMGLIQNIGINDGKLTANNASSSQETYLGTLVAKNSGKIRGCYFIQKRSEPYGIVHSSKSNQFVGGMVGDNTGSITGCYLISDMLTNNIKAIAGNNHGKTDNILNCYFNVKGETTPGNLRYAYDDVPWQDFYVGETQMKTKEFATWLSSNLYAGTFEQGTVGEFIGSSDTEILNEGLPYLALFQLAKYDIGSYFNEQEKSMMLSVWNITDDGDNSFGSLNGLFAADSLEYKYFNSIIIHSGMQFDMTLIQQDIDYSISARLYGGKAVFNTDVTNGVLNSNSANVKDISVKSQSSALLLNIQTEVSTITSPNLIVATISLKKGSNEIPWGNYRIDTN